MNIFFLDKDPVKAAQYHCNKHVVKMIVETLQILSAVHHRYGTHVTGMYKPTHAHHPCTIWAGDSTLHYKWTVQLLLALLYEYTHRYGKIHKGFAMYPLFVKPPRSMPTLTWQTPAKAMPEHLRKTTVVNAYRRYYIEHKAHFAVWTNRPIPKWFEKGIT